MPDLDPADRAEIAAGLADFCAWLRSVGIVETCRESFAALGIAPDEAMRLIDAAAAARRAK